MQGVACTQQEGLDGLIGEPRKDVAQAVEDEHCSVPSGFGASDFELTTGNYQVLFTPRLEYAFVADASFLQPMGKYAPLVSFAAVPLQPTLVLQMLGLTTRHSTRLESAKR
eukprot:SAG11_NODE_1764_length_4288_cov_3.044163_3_plen_111_part_00